MKHYNTYDAMLFTFAITNCFSLCLAVADGTSFLASMLHSTKSMGSLGNYGDWCGATHTKIGKHGCECQYSTGMVQTCREVNGVKDDLDEGCLKHDLCTHCQKPRFAYGTWALYIQVPSLNGAVHWCGCERNLYIAAKKARCRGSTARRAHCKLYRKAVKSVFKNYPCACPTHVFNCYAGFLWNKKWYDCNAEIVSSFRKCKTLKRDSKKRRRNKGAHGTSTPKMTTVTQGPGETLVTQINDLVTQIPNMGSDVSTLKMDTTVATMGDKSSVMPNTESDFTNIQTIQSEPTPNTESDVVDM